MSRGTGRPGTGYSCSPETRSGARLVAMTDSRSARAEQVGDDRRAVDHLLEVVEDEQDLPRRRATRRGGRAAVRPAGLDEPERRSAIRDATRPGSRTGSSGTNQTPSANSLGDVGGELEREAGLAGAAGPGQRQQPGRREEAAGLAPAPPRGRRSSSAGSAGCSAGGRATGSAGSRSAGRRSRAGRSAPAGGPSGGARRGPRMPTPVRQLVGDERRGRLRQQDLAAVPGRRRPGPRDGRRRRRTRRRHRARRRRCGGPSGRGRRRRPARARRRAAAGRRRRPRPRRTPPEHGEEGVALGLLLVAADRRDGRPDQLAVAGQEGRPALAAEAPGRACVEPSMSVNRKVTVPVGLGARERGGCLYVSDAAAPSPTEGARRGRGGSPGASVGLSRSACSKSQLREGEAARRLGRDDLGDARQPVEDRQLAEELAGPEDRASSSPSRTTRTEPVDDEEEAGPDLALAGDDVVGREVDLDRPVARPRRGRSARRRRTAGRRRAARSAGPA